MATAPVTFDPAAIEADLNQLTKILPLLTTFFPPLKVLVPFLPLIQGLLETAKDLEDSPHDPASIIAVLSQRLEMINADLQSALPRPTTAAPVQGPAQPGV